MIGHAEGPKRSDAFPLQKACDYHEEVNEARGKEGPSKPESTWEFDALSAMLKLAKQRSIGPRVWKSRVSLYLNCRMGLQFKPASHPRQDMNGRKDSDPI